MRILVVGAGAIGGYFGGRLLKAGRDVTFLVRPKRASALAETGLVIRSPKGDVDIARPPTVTADRLDSAFDLILLSCKAFDLEDAIASFAGAVGPETMILPLLNGMSHLDALDARLGAGHVLGGQCVISSALDAEGRILHLNDHHALTFGERDGTRSIRIEAVAAVLSGAGFDARLTETILPAMWEKWVFISSIAGITCLMRASIGDVAAAGGADLAMALHAECAAIAGGQGFPPGASATERARATVTMTGSDLTASMLRDMEQGARIEADHIIGDLLRRGREGASPLLRTVYIHLKAYEARRARGS